VLLVSIDWIGEVEYCLGIGKALSVGELICDNFVIISCHMWCICEGNCKYMTTHPHLFTFLCLRLLDEVMLEKEGEKG
jgi:hypothetical protein